MNDAEMSPSLALRAALLTILAMVVSGALLTGSLGFVLGAFMIGEPLGSSDRIGLAIFGGLSLVVAWRGFVAARRGREGRAGGEAFVTIARFSPALMLLGALVGAWFIYCVERDHASAMRSSAQSLCATVGHVDDASCVGQAIVCIARTRDAHEDPSVGHYRSDDPAQRPEALCLKERLQRR